MIGVFRIFFMFVIILQQYKYVNKFIDECFEYGFCCCLSNILWEKQLGKLDYVNNVYNGFCNGGSGSRNYILFILKIFVIYCGYGYNCNYWIYVYKCMIYFFICQNIMCNLWGKDNVQKYENYV